MSLRSAIKDLQLDFRVHGRSWRNRGVWAMAIYRYGRWVDELPRTPVRWLLNAFYGTLTLIGPVFTGVALDRRTRIGRQLHIVHPGMIMIHSKAQIGDRVGIMHGVTLGTSPQQPGVPVIGNDVFIGCHATILGGITIGDGARIAANSLVICDVPAGATAIGVPAKVYPAGMFGNPANAAGARPALRGGATGTHPNQTAAA